MDTNKREEVGAPLFGDTCERSAEDILGDAKRVCDAVKRQSWEKVDRDPVGDVDRAIDITRREGVVCDAFDRLISDLEREREAHYHAVGRANGFEFRANDKYAMRKEFEALLGIEHGAAGDEQFQKGMDAIRALLSDRRRLRKVEHLAKLGYHLSMYAAEIQWDGCRNRAAWLDGLRDAIVELQQQYRDTFGED